MSQSSAGTPVRLAIEIPMQPLPVQTSNRNLSFRNDFFRCIGKRFRVRTRNQHVFVHRERQSHELPLADYVLQRLMIFSAHYAALKLFQRIARHFIRKFKRVQSAFSKAKCRKLARFKLRISKARFNELLSGKCNGIANCHCASAAVSAFTSGSAFPAPSVFSASAASVFSGGSAASEGCGFSGSSASLL